MVCQYVPRLYKKASSVTGSFLPGIAAVAMAMARARDDGNLAETNARPVMAGTFPLTVSLKTRNFLRKYLSRKTLIQY